MPRREDLVRHPNRPPWKGLRTKFRTALQAGSEFKYRTAFLRRWGVFEVELRKGDKEAFKALVEERGAPVIEALGYMVKVV